MNIHIQFAWQLEIDGQMVPMDPLLFQLLSGIKAGGSLQQSAKASGISYRYAWGLMDKWSALLQTPLITKQRGRGTQLAMAGEKLLQSQQQLQARYAPSLANQATEIALQLSSLQQTQQTRHLKIYASHGLAVSALRDRLTHLEETPVDLHFHGNLESLRALKQHECDIAGFHLPEGPLARSFAEQFLEYLSPEQHCLVYLVRRLQGLMLAPGNPRGIQTLADLQQADLRFVNRQKGSGTRYLLDQLLLQQGIDSLQIAGYAVEEFTHMAVAAMVASGVADCGFGIEAAASRFELDFVPLQWEHYCLAIDRANLHSEHVQVLLACLRGPDLRQELHTLKGYQLERCGELVPFEAVFDWMRPSRSELR